MIELCNEVIFSRSAYGAIQPRVCQLPKGHSGKHYEFHYKLREKAAAYDNCMSVAKKLAWLVYQMDDAPKPPQEIKEYLENFFGEMIWDSTTCIVCRGNLAFSLFSKAQRGRAEIETGHINPRVHNADNVGFAHRECNIAQGNKTVLEFYEWIREIIKRVDGS